MTEKIVSCPICGNDFKVSGFAVARAKYCPACKTAGRARARQQHYQANRVRIRERANAAYWSRQEGQKGGALVSIVGTWKNDPDLIEDVRFMGVFKAHEFNATLNAGNMEGMRVKKKGVIYDVIGGKLKQVAS